MTPRERAFYLRLGHELREQREARGLRLIDVAVELDIEQMTLSRWERGMHRMPVYHYTRLTEFFQRPAA